MELHASLLAALADTHRRDLLADAQNYRTAAALRRAARAAFRRPEPPDPPAPPARSSEKADEKRRYVMSR